MTLKALLSALAILSATSAAASTATYDDDVCLLDPTATAAGADCALIEQTPTSPVGLFTLTVGGLDPNIAGPAMITISAIGDLFQNDDQIAERGGGRNNPEEYFGLSLDSYFIGILFDDSDTELPADIFEDIVASTDAATNSVGLFELSFSLPESVMAPLVADGMVDVLFDFRFSGDPNYNVNLFRSVSATIEYETGGVAPPSEIPLPASALLLLCGLGGLRVLTRR